MNFSVAHELAHYFLIAHHNYLKHGGRPHGSKTEFVSDNNSEREADAFAAGHIKGAVNLPFTDFTAASLARVIGNKDRPILIYCNNNFSNNKAPVETKAVRLALNIQTFINLVGYGYANVRELNEVVDFNDPKIGWVTTPVAT